MNQAFHIFLKDARRLRMQIAVLMMAIAYFAVMDIRWSARSSGGAGSLIIEFVTGGAVWLLIARVVHEESLTGEDEFWLTRPYEMRSLFAARIMMAVCAVAIPLFVADCVIVSAQSLSVGGSFWGLILRQLPIAGWLILPPFAIASVTRSLQDDVMIWLGLVTLAGLTYFPGVMNRSNDFRAANEKYWLACGLVLVVAAVWRQYSRRGFFANRAMIAAALLLPVLPFPEAVALGIEQLRSQPGTAGIRLTATADNVEEPPVVGYSGDSHCAPIPVTIDGMRPGWRLAVLSQHETFESPGKMWQNGWHQITPSAADFGHVPGGSVSACAGLATIREMGAEKPVAAHVSIALAVFAAETPIRVRATLSPFEVRGIGTCQFLPYLETNHVLSCKSPVWFPPVGRVAVAGAGAWSSPISGTQYPWLPLNLLPGMSPVYKWITMPMDDGSLGAAVPPRNAWFGLQNLIQTGGEIEFSPEKRIAVLRREVEVRQVRFQGIEQ